MFLDFTQEMVSWSAVTRVQRRSQVFESVCWMIDAHRCFIVLDLTSQRLDRDYVFIVARIKPRLKKQLRLPLFALPLQIPSCTNSSNDKHASDFIEDAIVYTLLISPVDWLSRVRLKTTHKWRVYYKTMPPSLQATAINCESCRTTARICHESLD